VVKMDKLSGRLVGGRTALKYGHSKKFCFA
jgi:hypothetical protein